MSEWKEYKLGNAPLEIIDGDRGKNYPSQNEFFKSEYCLFLSTRNVRKNGFDFSDCQFINKEKDDKLRKGKLMRFDSVLTTRGTIGNIGYFDESVPFENIRINSGMIVIRPNIEELNSKYCFYIFRKLNKEFESFVSGSAQPQLPIKDLNEIEIKIPELTEQNEIAEILSSLDDKIDLLHRQNKTLEQLAETLFRQWFVEEAEESWEVSTLGDIISIYDSQRIPVSSMEREKMKIGELYPYYGAATIMDYVNDYIFDGEYILMGEDGTVETIDGYPILQLPVGKFWVNNHAHIFQSKKPFTNFFIYIFLKRKNISNIVTGAVQPKINQAALKSIEFIIPDKNILDKYLDLTNDFWNKIKNNNNQIISLTKLRDTLLPKLMSGELRMKIN